MSRPDSADVRTHRMIYPNRKPLLISAILVALTSVPTLVVVAAGTVSLDGHSPHASTAVGAPSDAPVIIEPGSSSGLTERPPAAGQAVQAVPMVVHTLPRVVSSLRGTGHRLVPRRVPVPPVVQVVPTTTTPPPIVPEEVPTPVPPVPPAQEPSPSPSPSRDYGSPAPPRTPAEPRIDDQAWPGWDAHLSGG